MIKAHAWSLFGLFVASPSLHKKINKLSNTIEDSVVYNSFFSKLKLSV